MSNSKTQRKRRAWPEKRRKNQAENCRKTRPWEHTTGPKTESGKEAVKANAIKHGLYTAEGQSLRHAIRSLAAFNDELFKLHKMQQDDA